MTTCLNIWETLNEFYGLLVTATAVQGSRRLEFKVWHLHWHKVKGISPLMQPVICGFEWYDYDNKLALPVEELFRA